MAKTIYVRLAEKLKALVPTFLKKLVADHADAMLDISLLITIGTGAYLCVGA